MRRPTARLLTRIVGATGGGIVLTGGICYKI